MTIAPIVQSVSVAVPPVRAFRLFSQSMGRWWAPHVHIAPKPFAEIVLEPHAGGRWFERDLDGGECDWGRVIAWEPPQRMLFAWQIDASFHFDPDLATEVEVRFDPDGAGTLVTLTHRHLERFGPSAAATAAKLAGGWPGLVQRFALYTAEESDDE